MNAIRQTTLAIMFSATLLGNELHAQSISDDECPQNDPVEGVIWDITTDANGRVYATANGGILKSCDAGDTWSRPTSSYAPGLAVLASPTIPNTVFFGSTTNFYFSDNHGDTFSVIGANIGENIWSIAADSTGILFAGAESAIFRSDDAGSTWHAIQGSPAGFEIQALAVDYSNDNVIFVGTNGGGFYRSIDGGLTWERQFNGNSRWQVKEILQDPLNPSVIFAASWDGLWRSSDAGSSWNRVAGGRMVDIAADPLRPANFFAVSRDQGVLKSVDGGNTWVAQAPITGVPAEKMYSLAVLESGRILVGTEFLGMHASDDGGRTWHISGTGPVNDPVPPGGNDGDTPVGSPELYAEIEYLGSGSVPAGQDARFRFTIRNTGTAVSDHRFVNIAWFRSPLVGYNESFNFTVSTTQGQCRRSVTPVPDCDIGPIAPGGVVTITINGETRPDNLGWYTLRTFMIDSQGFNNADYEFSIGTSVTVAESGGGSAGWFLILLLSIANVRRCFLREHGVEPRLCGDGH